MGKRALRVAATILGGAAALSGAVASCAADDVDGSPVASDTGPRDGAPFVVGPSSDAGPGPIGGDAAPIGCVDGVLDPSFGDCGIVQLPVSGRVTLRSDGHYVVAGGGLGANLIVTVATINPRGQLEWSSSFPAAPSTDAAAPRGFSSVDGLGAASGGGVVVGGTWYEPSSDLETLGLARLLADGGLDPSFGDGGIVSAMPPVATCCARVPVVQPDRRIVVAGTKLYGGSFLARYLADGRLEPSFGPDPTSDADVRGLSEDFFEDHAAPEQLLLLRDGTFLVFGDNQILRFSADGLRLGTLGSGIGAGAAVDGANRLVVRVRSPGLDGLQRYLSTGALDPTFGEDGSVPIYAPGAFEAFEGLFVAPSAEIIVASATLNSGEGLQRPQDFFLTRFLQNGTPDLTFGDAGAAEVRQATNFTGMVLDPTTAGGALVVSVHGSVPALLRIRL